jgi:hypothetical protein
MSHQDMEGSFETLFHLKIETIVAQVWQVRRDLIGSL